MAGTAEGVRSRRLGVLAGAGVVGLLLAYVALVRTTAGQRIDGEALEHRFAVTEDAQRRMAWLLDVISARSVLACSAALVLVALLRRRPALAVGVVAGLGGSAVAARALKDHLLTRTDLGGFGGVSYNTFPSGHATVGIALALALVMVTPARLAWAAVAVASVVAPAVGAATTATGGHRPSDSVGAYLATLAWFSACAAGVAWVDRPEPSPVGAPARSWGRSAAAVAASLAVSAALLAHSLAGPARRPGVGAGPYAVGVLGIDLVGIVVVAAFAAVLHGLVDRRRRAPHGATSADRSATGVAGSTAGARHEG